MIRRYSGVLFLSLLVPLLVLHADPKLSLQLLNASYVAVGYETAAGFIGETDLEAFRTGKVTAEDREALENVRSALQRWNRYAITLRPQDAELLIAIRSGRIASLQSGVQINTGRNRSPGVGPTVGAEVGPDTDVMSVYEANNGREGPRLWRKLEDDGLKGQNPSLFMSFKSDVEALAKKKKP
jgi:hypothetical protein